MSAPNRSLTFVAFASVSLLATFLYGTPVRAEVLADWIVRESRIAGIAQRQSRPGTNRGARRIRAPDRGRNRDGRPRRCGGAAL